MFSLLTDSLIFKAIIRRFFFLLVALHPLVCTAESAHTPAPSEIKIDHSEINTNPLDTSPYLIEEEKPAPLDDDHFFREFINMLGTLALLIAFMVFASWVLKRMLNQRVQQLNTGSSIKVVEKRALSNKAAVFLIEVEGKAFLVGESMHNLSLIATFPEGLKEEFSEEEQKEINL